MSTAKITSSVALALVLTASQLAAQTPAPAQPAPGAPAPYYPPQPYPYPPPHPYPPQYYPPPQPYPPPYYYPPPAPYQVQRPPPAPAEPPAWSPGEPAPPGYYVDSNPDWKLAGHGAALLGSFWAISVVGGAIANEANDTDDYAVLYVPVAGPFLAMQYVDSKQGGFGMLLLDGVFQSAGAIAIVIGLATRKERLIPIDSGSLELRLVPGFSRRHGGLSVSGHF